MFGLLKIAWAEPRTPVPEELQYLEESNRGEWQMPERVIDALRLQKSDVVADVGAGTGYFSRRFARLVAHVYAEDVDPQALRFLRREALAKVTVVAGKPENPMLPPNKGEARNALARAVFFNRLGELGDRTLENQQHRASGLNLVVAAIVLWNTVYLERAVQSLRNRGQMIPEALLVHLSPLKWEHINLTGDYHWRRDGGLRNRKSRPLRTAFAQPKTPR